MKPHSIRRLRQIVQILALLLYLYIFIAIRYQRPGLVLSQFFYHLDPLAVLVVALAGRILLTGMALSLITLLLTLLFGRVWCGWFCPLGTLLEWLAPKRSRKHSIKASPPPEVWRSFKYFLLLVMLFAALLGNQTLSFLDPITILTRTLGNAVWPALGYAVYQVEALFYRFDFLWGTLDAIHQALVYPAFQDVEAVFIHGGPIFILFIALIALNWWAERFWCRYLCPLGGLLGLISRLAWVRREVSESCSACALCTPACPTGTIDAANGFRSDPAECTVCYDCIVACQRADVAFRRQNRELKPAPSQPYDLSRGDVLRTAGLALVGVALSGVETISRQQPAMLLRPPGATLTDFTALCLRCGECVRVCPTQGLQASLLEGGWQNLFTPMLVPRLGYCSFTCNACGQVCPSGAIPLLPPEIKQSTPIGLASVDRNRCLPWAYDTACIVCEEVCPVADKAIKLEKKEVVTTKGEVLTLQLPRVVKELCIGCGICEYKCPMGGEAAIRVYAQDEVNI